MSLHHIANHLAAKGRHGDSTLVHMTKGEVAGLQALARRNGTTLTKNPDTGLPEAFSLKSLIPMAAGFMLAGPAGMSAMGAGLSVGGAYTLATGSLKQGLMAGLGAYGGAGLGGASTGASASVTGPGGAAPANAAIVETPITTPAANAAPSPFTPSPQTGPLQSTLPNPSTMTPQVGYTAPGAAPINVTPTTVTGTTPPDLGYANMDPNAASAANPYAGAPTTTTAPTTSVSTAPIGDVTTATSSPVTGGNGGAGAAPASKSFESVTARASADPKLIGYAAAPAIAEELTPKPYKPEEFKGDSDMGQRYAYDSGYSNDVPGRTGPASYSAISGEDAKKLYGFAEGGDVQYPAGESVIRMADGGAAGYTGGVGDYSAADAQGARSGYGLGIDYSGYDTTPNAGLASLSAARQSAVAAPEHGFAFDPTSKQYVGSVPGDDMVYQGGGKYGMSKAAMQAMVDLMGSQVFAKGGGISTLGGYSDGGRLLKGPGDGMSDNIPAKIGEKQPARLADGEFVVPADVVSHLGNGSTDAGAKQLYKMMDKIRTARTGRKAQGKQVNPNKFLPA